MFGLFRTWLALMVVLHHFLHAPHIGYWAVTSFFVLSGFLMTTILRGRYGFTLDGLRRFAVNRGLRLFPAYWATLLFAGIVAALWGSQTGAFALPQTLGGWLSNLTMIFPAYQPITVEPRLVTPVWALTIELFFYALMALGFSRNPWFIRIWFVASLTFTLRPLVGGGVPHIDYGSFGGASLPFALGALLAADGAFLRRRLPTLFRAWRPLALMFVLNQAGAVLVGLTLGVEGWKLAFLGEWINLGLTALLVLALFDLKPSGPKARARDDRWGAYSYPLYLVHMPAGFAIQGAFGLSFAAPLGFMLSLGLTVLLSAALIHGIDRPIDRVRKSFGAR